MPQETSKRIDYRRKQIIVEKVTRTRLRESASSLKQPVFVLVTGYAHAGKTTLVESDPFLRQCFSICNDTVRFSVIDELPEYTDRALLIDSAEHSLISKVAQECRVRLFEHAAERGLAIVLDGCNLHQKERHFWIEYARRINYSTKIIWVQTPDSVLRQRLLEDDRTYRGIPRTPLIEYYDLHHKIYEPPAAGEADQLLIYNSPQYPLLA